MRKALGAKHPDVGAWLNNLGMLLKAMGRLQEAEPLLRERLEIMRSGPPKYGGFLHNFGMLLQDMGRLQDAEPLLRESFDMRRSDPDLGPEHSKTKESLKSLRSLLQAMGRLED